MRKQCLDDSCLKSATDKAEFFDVIVVGGGAAGLCAAIAAARAGARVGIVEAKDRLGKKILATGNGRCNLSNVSIGSDEAAQLYNNPDFVRHTLNTWPFARIDTFFTGLGLLLAADERGWVYPHTRWANSVLAVLLNAIAAYKIVVITDYQSTVLANGDGSYTVTSESKEELRTAALVIASGQPPKMKGCVLEQTALVPLLGPLGVSAQQLKGLDGVRVHCQMQLYRSGLSVDAHSEAAVGDEFTNVSEATSTCERGELLFRKQSVSGIAVFNLSRFAQIGDILAIDLFPEYSPEYLVEQMMSQKDFLPDTAPLSDFLAGMLHPRLALTCIRACSLKPDQLMTEGLARRLAKQLKNLQLTITARPLAAQAQVTRGGFRVSEFCAQTLASSRYFGLFAAGECLDVDAPCGGYNLHWAWASGLVAGQAAADFGAKANRQNRV